MYCSEEGQIARAAQFYFKFLEIGQFFAQGDSGGGSGSTGVYSDGTDVHRTATRRAGYTDTHTSGSGGSSNSVSLLNAVLNTSSTGGLDNNMNTSTYISKAVAAVISQQQLRGDGCTTSTTTGSNSDVCIVDSEQAEALLFLAQYHRSINALPLAEVFCSRYVYYTVGFIAL